MGLPLWREPEDSAPRRSTTRSPAHPVIARSPIAHVPSPRRTTLSPRRRQLREARERRLRQMSELFDNDDGETQRAPNLRTIFDSPEESYEPDALRDALHTRTYTPPTQDARALDQVVSYLSAREPLVIQDLSEALDREQSAESTNPESTTSARFAIPHAPDRSRDTPPYEGVGDRVQMHYAPVSFPLTDVIRVPTRRSEQTLRHYRRSRINPSRGRPGRGRRRPGVSVDGLGDRDRSLSPEGDGLWDNLLTTLTPDPQPPSVGSSFASTTASTSASQNPTIPSSRTSITSPGEAAEPPCDPVSELEGSSDDWRNGIGPDIEALGANPTSSPDDLAFISSMHAIIRRLASREDIPDEWWERAGLSRSMSWEGDN
ncbi:uncharacterized protein F4807DRAFT_444199 [Annulohypoxylon truncatum]|uniref:uncharacterized protein n=1 Tax=Annulohypoxylon truncatum TaxID=327061 RepID=UPI002008C79A|nr:uncharacterized protein F4807DRAFT_444199 [Annulohypoxylon truncatum]KAI1205164.1 hypothetical protein F4807DRAFT_444199 [Annulohypoxylon truncatum]